MPRRQMPPATPKPQAQMPRTTYAPQAQMPRATLAPQVQMPSATPRAQARPSPAAYAPQTQTPRANPAPQAQSTQAAASGSTSDDLAKLGPRPLPWEEHRVYAVETRGQKPVKVQVIQVSWELRTIGISSEWSEQRKVFRKYEREQDKNRPFKVGALVKSTKHQS